MTHITPTELQYIRALAEGDTLSDVAARIGCTKKTVRVSVERVRVRFGAATLWQLFYELGRAGRELGE